MRLYRSTEQMVADSKSDSNATTHRATVAHDGAHDHGALATPASALIRPDKEAISSVRTGGAHPRAVPLRARQRPTEDLAYALRAHVPEMSPNHHQQPTMATGSNLRT